jgi:hypothetical protein
LLDGARFRRLSLALTGQLPVKLAPVHIGDDFDNFKKELGTLIGELGKAVAILWAESMP